MGDNKENKIKFEKSELQFLSHYLIRHKRITHPIWLIIFASLAPSERRGIAIDGALGRAKILAPTLQNREIEMALFLYCILIKN